MKLWCVFLFFFCSSALSYELNPLNITEQILSSSRPTEEATLYFHKSEAMRPIAELGTLGSSTCFLNHNSDVFDTVTCQITTSSLKNGLVFEFYYFLDGTKWIGTNVKLVQSLPIDSCISNIELNRGIGKGLKFKKIKC